MRPRRILATALAVALMAVTASTGAPTPPAAAAELPRVLVFTRTVEYRHSSIPHAVDVLRDIGAADGFAVDHTEDPTWFNPATLAGYQAVVWLSTTGDVLDAAQQAAFEGYIRGGGGYAGIHAASDTEYDWPWYGQLVGAWFDRHPPGVHSATIDVEDRTHVSTAHLPARWTRTDEWYDFRTNPRAAVHVLATLDESTYAGGGMGADHPIAWCQRFDGGRSWYTAGGHNAGNYDETRFRAHLSGGIRWAAGLVDDGCGPAPDDPGTSPPPPPPGPGGPVEPSDASVLVPVTPTRVLDTRVGQGAPTGPVADEGRLDVAVAGHAGVPDDAVAVAVNVTAVDASGPGYVTAWPADRARPLASNLNVERAGQTIANAAVVQLGADGRLSLYAQRSTHLLLDVTGYWTASGPARAGRFLPTMPSRLLDTRDGTGTGGTVGALASDGELVLQVAGRGGVPSSGAAAVALNVTATGATGAGYVTVWPDGPRPLVSTLNVEEVGQTIPNQAIVPVGADGRIRLYAQTGTDLVVDVAGWFTDEQAARSDGGRFVAVTPTRLLDTRPDGWVEGGSAVSVELFPVPASSAVVLNVTATEATAPGFVTAVPDGAPVPNASNLNVTRAGQTIANLVVAPTPGGRRVGLYAQERLHVVVDLAGWFTPATAA